MGQQTKEDRKELYQRAYERWGAEAQVAVAIEELSELIKALSAIARHGMNDGVRRDIAGEIADVRIMCEQVEAIYDLGWMTNRIEQAKLERLERRLGTNPERSGDE